MQLLKTFVAAFVVSLFLGFINVSYAQDAKPDTTKEGYVLYKNVDVTVTYTWSDDVESYQKVDAAVKTENGKTVAIILYMRDGTKYEIALIKEVTIKIYDHNTGKLIKVFGNQNGVS